MMLTHRENFNVLRNAGENSDPCLQAPVLEQFLRSPRKIALLVTSEYEGIFKNGGIGTYYKTLSQKLAESGWHVVVLLSQTNQVFQGNSLPAAVGQFFSVAELPDLLHLQLSHQRTLQGIAHWDWVERENFSILWFVQAIAAALKSTELYVEFPEMCGLGYRTTQAKRAGLLPQNCTIAVTLHSGHEWIYEANEKYQIEGANWFRQVIGYEQRSFEQADLPFFVSHFLKEKVTKYGWLTDQAIHLPYCFPVLNERSPLAPQRDPVTLSLKPGQIPLVFFGRLEERKGLTTFLQALKQLDPSFTQRLHIIFLGKDVQLYSAALQHLTSSQYIAQVLGTTISYEIVADRFSAEAIQLIRDLPHPIVCLTSPQENFPNSALEMGQLPVQLVVTATGGFQETLGIIERSAGIHWFHPNHELSLTTAITEAIAVCQQSPDTPSVEFLKQVNQQLLHQRLVHMAIAIGQDVPILDNQDSNQLSMLSYAERQFLETHLCYGYQGWGEIVELGCWLGSSTIHIAKGLQYNRALRGNLKPIHVYDQFLWNSGMEEAVVGSRLENVFQQGDSFLETYQQRIQPWKSLIQIHAGDLVKLGWQGSPIEFLFIDAMKSWNLANSILQNFFPHLVPQRSIIQHQDFAHYYTVWIHLITYRLRHYFEPIDQPQLHPSKVFRCIAPIPEEVLQAGYSLASFSEAEMAAAFDYSFSIMPPQGHPNIAGARVKLLLDLGQPDRAQAELQMFKAQFPNWQSSDLARVDALLNKEAP
jgi:glycosyltransferase involved in cell wall biosynthesis